MFRLFLFWSNERVIIRRFLNGTELILKIIILETKSQFKKKYYLFLIQFLIYKYLSKKIKHKISNQN